MAELRQYDPSKPWISVNLPTKEEIIAATLGLIPGYRALKNFHDNPEGPFTETLDLAAEDLVPLYGSLIKPAIKGEDVDAEQALKEAAIFGIPLPFTKYPKGHPKAGEAIPNNLKEGYGNRWRDVKWYWKNNRKQARKLYADPNAINYRGNKDGGLSTRTRVGATQDVRGDVNMPVGPYQRTNIGSNVVSEGAQARNNNTRPTYNLGSRGTEVNGAHGWQGDMYPPGRTLRNDTEYGPFQWEDKYSRKLDNVIDENEQKWEYLINKTRPFGTKSIPKQDIADIAIKQGRPDIAERVLADDKPRVSSNPKSPTFNKRFASYSSNQKGELKDNAKWKDYGNRQVEKELRETFAALPNDQDIRYRFAKHYGVPDLYQSWIEDPLWWAKYKNDTQINRYFRESGNRSRRRAAGWENPNQ